MKMVVGAVQLSWPYGDTVHERREVVRNALATVPACDLVVLPEMWPVGFERFDEYAAAAEPVTGPTFALGSEFASGRGCYAVPGSFVECSESGSLHNTAMAVGPDGRSVAMYRKSHLFGFGSGESAILVPGDRPVAFDTPSARVGLAICYDLRFPEFFRALVSAGVEVVTVIAAWPAARIEAWSLLLRARAVENQVYVVGCNLSGSDGAAVYGGCSMVISPRGEVMTTLGRESGVLTAELDLRDLRRLRHEFPVLGAVAAGPGDDVEVGAR